MHARVSTYHADDPARLVDGFKSVTGELEHVDGFAHAFFLIDRESGKALSITIWENEEAMQASQAKADELRRQATQPTTTSIVSVDPYEIVLEVASPTTARV
jgi:heme-degrading monooxygenase HmoA